MKTFTQIIDQAAHNVVFGNALDEALKNSFSPEFVQKEIAAGRPWVQVEDAVRPNWTVDGQGNWSPPAAQPTPAPQVPEVTMPELCKRLDDLTALTLKIADFLKVPH